VAKTCGETQYLDGDDCVDCTSPCMKCTGANVCSSCVEGYNLDKDNHCIQCATGQVFDSEKKECVEKSPDSSSKSETTSSKSETTSSKSETTSSKSETTSSKSETTSSKSETTSTSNSGAPQPPAQQSSQGVPEPASKSSDGGSNAGLIAGVVVAAVAAAALIAVAIYCIATAGKKRGKVDPVIYEEDPEFVSMSVL